jgi:hypothetical protein
MTLHGILLYKKGGQTMLKQGYKPEEEIIDYDDSEAQRQTIARAYQMMENGTNEWVALGIFSHDWFGNHRTRRIELITEPIVIHGPASLHHWRWAVFCVASITYLCKQAEIPAPAWTQDPRYILHDPWFMGANAEKLWRRAELLIESPPEFQERNIFCSSRIWANKYERSKVG